ncbi:MAG TPA: hypothetical protein DIW82_02715 [Corynebacterium nuruki]|uniref:ATP/GTP-binding protein n=1 Tax=Corynebacterium nuruki TaxID=1032851 RepID=A0A3D4SWQ7_9CORY|nr:hypothetical protein [Corynebacterium nuruki]
MPRHNRRATPVPRGRRTLPSEGSTYWGTRRETGPGWAMGETYLVRHMGASAARKFYVCPGCNQNIPPGVAHIFAWPDTHRGGEDRRHWHTACWDRR